MSGTIEVAATDPVHILRVRGRCWPQDGPRLLRAVTGALSIAIARVVVCELSEFQAVSRVLMTAFPTAVKLCGGWPAVSLHLASPRPEVRQLLDRMGMGRFVPIHATLTEAIIASQDDAVSQVHTFGMDADVEQLTTVRALARTMWPELEHMPSVAHELAMNAVIHSREAFTLALVATRTRAIVATTDVSQQPPGLVDPATRGGIGGYGLHIVDELSDEWGVRWVYPRGKTVWAAVARR